VLPRKGELARAIQLPTRRTRSAGTQAPYDKCARPTSRASETEHSLSYGDPLAGVWATRCGSLRAPPPNSARTVHADTTPTQRPLAASVAHHCPAAPAERTCPPGAVASCRGCAHWLPCAAMPLLRPRLPAWRWLAVGAAALLLTMVTTEPLATASEKPESTDSTDGERCTDSGESLRYLVLFDEDTTRGQARREVKRACGKLSVYYAPIAVGIATSTDPQFVDKIGPSRAFSAQAHRASESGLGSAKRRIADQQPPADLSTEDRSAEQWGLDVINARAARATSRTNEKVVVGVLDSGIDDQHPELAGVVDAKRSASCLDGKPDRSRKAWRPSTSVHGTHVAGTIAAADDHAGVVGVAPGVRLASIKVI